MRWWWVNQNQTYEAEFNGGYIWSPKRNKNGVRNQFYENMRSVAPGDLIFSFRNLMIVAVGRSESYAYDAPKPKEFGTSGANWEPNGWMVDVRYFNLTAPIRPKAHIDRIRPFLPAKYSPLQESGDGLQSVYLAELPKEMAMLLLDLLRKAGNDTQIEPSPAHESGHREQVVSQVEDDLESAIENAPDISITEKEQIVKARRGQGRFRVQLLLIEKACRLSGITDAQFLA
jgi:hypothetical protein